MGACLEHLRGLHRLGAATYVSILMRSPCSLSRGDGAGGDVALESLNKRVATVAKPRYPAAAVSDGLTTTISSGDLSCGEVRRGPRAS
jgi:hypothetical protein